MGRVVILQPFGYPGVYVARGDTCLRCLKTAAGVATSKKKARRVAYRLMGRPHTCTTTQET